jgi:AraC-like DNA-binding protein
MGAGHHDCIRFHAFPVSGVEAMSARTARSFPRHTHDQFGIGVIDHGGHASWSGRGQVEAGPRQFICVNPGEVHDGHAIGRASRSWRILYLDPSVLLHLRTDILEGGDPSFTFAQPTFPDDGLRPLFEAAFSHALWPPNPGDIAHEVDLIALVARLGSHATRGAVADRGPPVRIQRVRERIDDDPSAPLTLAGLAQEAGLSRYQLIRAFARELHMTPHAYLLQRRVALAQRLIRRGHALADVAIAAGFYDQSHLNRCFLKHLGVTPAILSKIAGAQRDQNGCHERHSSLPH